MSTRHLQELLMLGVDLPPLFQDVPGVYSIEKEGCRFYVGSSVRMVQRVRTHFRHLVNNTHRNPHLQRAFNQGGRFVVSVIEETSRERLREAEQRWLDDFAAVADGYNIAPRAYGAPTENPEVARRVGESLRKRYAEHELPERAPVTDAHRSALKASWTPERRAAQAERMRERRKDPEVRAKMDAAISAGCRKPRSEQAKANISKAQSERWARKDQRDAQRARTLAYNARKRDAATDESS